MRCHARLLRRHDKGREHRQHRAVHGHGHRNPREVDASEQLPHVLNAIDGHAGVANVGAGLGGIRVVAAMGGQVEGHREALHAFGKALPEPAVGLCGAGEAGILPQSPGTLGIHAGVWAANKWRLAGNAIQMCQSL
ncbi:hypothetical protein FQZ97_1131740 [compost metagenome]